MQIILVDTITDEWWKVDEEDSNIKFEFSVDVDGKHSPIAEIDYDDNTAKSLVADIAGEGGMFNSMFVSLSRTKSKEVNYKLKLTEQQNCNALQRLWERFKHEVRLSVEINSKNRALPKTKWNDYNLSLVSAQGTVSDVFGYLFKSYSCSVNYPKLNALRNKSLIHIRIIAYIHDDLIYPNRYLARKTTMKILEDCVASDVIIEASNGMEIKGHKCFLISTSPVLRTMFGSGMEESKSGRIDMTDISEEGIRAFLRFLYQGDVIGPEEDIDVAYNVLYAAHKYDVPKLEKLMQTYLTGREDDDFDPGMAFKIYSFVKGIETASELKDKVTRIMNRNFKEVKELPEVKEVFKKNPADAIEFCEDLVSVMPSHKRKTDSEQNDTAKKSRTE